MDDPLLVGNNLAMLVAARELARRGRRPTLLTDGKPLGGHFAGLLLDGLRFDLGMVLIEKLSASADGVGLDSYEPRLRNDWTRFADLAACWLDACEPLIRTPTPQCLFEGHYVPDYLIANRLDAFHAHAVETLPSLERSDLRHAVHKNIGASYDRLSYADAANANHGEALHERFVEPFVRKLTGHNSTALLARYHRAAWVPLYYPDTLSKALRSDTGDLPEYPFWTNRSGCVGDLVAKTCEQMRISDRIRIVTEPLLALHSSAGRWTVGWKEQHCSSGQIALGLPVERARTLFGLEPSPPALASSVALLFCLVRADAIGRNTACLLVVDEGFASYRVTDQDALAHRDSSWHRVVVEASPTSLVRLSSGQPQQDILLRELCELMSLSDPAAVRVCKFMVAPNALVLPTADAVAQAASGHEQFVKVAPQAELTGGLLGYGATSMNDQIVQGLKIAEAFE